MFGFRHKLPEDFFRGASDIHSHLLPGVDDGFRTERKSLEALKSLEARGMARMVLTPHFMKDYPDNDSQSIRAKFEAFKVKAAEVSQIELRLAGEYMLDSRFMDHFKQGLLTLDKAGVHVLCETSYMMNDRNASQMIYEIMLEGISPVVAHPERYMYASMDTYEKWKDKRYKFQLNLLSLSGMYGKPAVSKALQLLENDFYDFVGSDIHALENFEHFLSRIRLSYSNIDKLKTLWENNNRLLG